MAVQADRRGLESQLDKNKLLPGENATTTDTHKTFKAFAPGVVKRMATYEDTVDMLDEALEEVKQNFAEGVEEAIDNAEIATGNANTATGHATTQGDYAKAQGDYAKAQGDAAASIVNDSIATKTIPGNVRGGGDIEVDTLTGDMSVIEASNANVTVVEAEEDREITTGLLSVILGLVKKKFSTILTALAGKLDKSSMVQSAEISDATKPVSSVVTAWLASQISSLSSSLSTLNNNLARTTFAITVNGTLFGRSLFYKENSKIHIEFNLSNTDNYANNAIVGVIPKGYIPTVGTGYIWCGLAYSSSAPTTAIPIYVRVDTNGNIILVNDSGVAMYSPKINIEYLV